MFRHSRVEHTTEMSFLDHLAELRYRIAVCLGAIVVTTLLIGLPFAKQFIEILIVPLRGVEIREADEPLTLRVGPDGAVRLDDPGRIARPGNLSKFRLRFVVEAPRCADDPTTPVLREFLFGPQLKQELYYFSPFDPFFIILKAALLLGIVVAIPIWLWQLWAFVAPAFTPVEMRVVRPVFLSAVFLFPLGAAFAYFGMQLVLEMLLNSFRISGLEPRLSIQSYVSIILRFMIIFGCVFETPVVVVLLVRMGLVSTRALRATRGYALVVIAVLSAFLTPADPFSMLLMAVPLWCLYEASIWISVALERKVEKDSRDSTQRERPSEEDGETD